jgi:hypothetical protein
VAVPEDGLAPYAAGIRTLRVEFGVPEDTELKWSPGDGSWLKTEAGKAACTPLREKTLDLAAEAGVTSIVLVWARGHLDWQVPAVRDKLLRWLYDKVSTFLGRRGAVGVVVADEPGGGPKDRAKWLRETLPLTDGGTGYTRPEHAADRSSSNDAHAHTKADRDHRVVRGPGLLRWCWSCSWSAWRLSVVG